MRFEKATCKIVIPVFHEEVASPCKGCGKESDSFLINQFISTRDQNNQEVSSDHESIRCHNCANENLPNCLVCAEALTDCCELVEINTGAFAHSLCFNCSVCDAALHGSNYRSDETLALFCFNCYQLRDCDKINALENAIKCSYCQNKVLKGQKRVNVRGLLHDNQSLEGHGRSADVYYHEECLRCFNCEEYLDYTTSLSSSSADNSSPPLFMRSSTSLYCQSCYNALFTVLCFSCKKFVTEPLVETVTGQSYHAACFRCSEKTCNKTLGATEAYKVEKSKPWCIDCYNFYFPKKCSKCSQTIEMDKTEGSVFLSYRGKIYHGTCFKCEQPKCTNILDAKLFHNIDSKLTCQNCAKSFHT